MCCKKAQAAEFAYADRSLAEMPRTGRYRPARDDDTKARVAAPPRDHWAALRALYTPGSRPPRVTPEFRSAVRALIPDPPVK